nr:unnamed protein product [Digitaria exilis]
MAITPKPKKTTTTALDTYGRDMTATAVNMDPVIGRDVEIDRVVRTLCRRTKSNAMLVGAPGLDLAALVAGTSLRGTLEQRLKSVIREAEDADGKVILFIDEMHMLISIGGKSNVNAANVLKPALARGRVRCVGATTLEEYRKYVEKDPALERRFQRIHVEEPSTEATVEIVRGLKRRYEAHHGLKIVDSTVIDKQKEVDASREVLVKKKKAIVLPEHVAQVVSLWTGIPVYTIGQEEKDKLIHLAERLHERVVGQDEAVNLVAQAVLRTRAGLDRSGQPIGCFLFLGSTGVGKTELAKALAEQLFDSEKFLIRLDMSEFVVAGSVLRLIGVPPSYIGQLTEKVRRRPYSVILFDEVEKADPSVFNAILQLLDDGVLTDGKGRTVDFKNTLIIMTSNLGAEHLAEAILMDGEETMEAARDLVMKQVHRHFKPEFLNRLSDVVIFEPLSRDKLKEVVKIQMKSIVANVADKGIFLSYGH